MFLKQFVPIFLIFATLAGVVGVCMENFSLLMTERVADVHSSSVTQTHVAKTAQLSSVHADHHNRMPVAVVNRSLLVLAALLGLVVILLRSCWREQYQEASLQMKILLRKFLDPVLAWFALPPMILIFSQGILHPKREA